jgi:transcriptional regulator with XRE-family HTH domain
VGNCKGGSAHIWATEHIATRLRHTRAALGVNQREFAIRANLKPNRYNQYEFVKNRSVTYEVEKGKPQKGTYESFKYAPLEEIDKHLRPLLAEEDMDLS